jgi:hypothetical protein
MQNAIEFNKDLGRSAEITWKQLVQTDTLADHKGQLPKQCPMEAGTLLQQIADNIHKYTKLSVLERPIIIKENYCTTSRNALKAERGLQLKDYQINRFVTKLLINSPAFAGTPDALLPGVAVTYANQKGNTTGIQIAFGENINVCDNLTAYGKFHFSTYGNSKVGFDEGMQLLNHWLQNFSKIHEAHLETIERLREVEVDKARFRGMIGHLFERAVAFNTGQQVFAPMNQTEVAAMVRQGMETLQKEDRLLTGWEIMNWGTHILKPQSSDMIGLLQSTTGFNDFVLESFDIPSISVDI